MVGCAGGLTRNRSNGMLCREACVPFDSGHHAGTCFKRDKILSEAELSASDWRWKS